MYACVRYAATHNFLCVCTQTDPEMRCLCARRRGNQKPRHPPPVGVIAPTVDVSVLVKYSAGSEQLNCERLQPWHRASIPTSRVGALGFPPGPAGYFRSPEERQHRVWLQSSTQSED